MFEDKRSGGHLKNSWRGKIEKVGQFSYFGYLGKIYEHWPNQP